MNILEPIPEYNGRSKTSGEELDYKQVLDQNQIYFQKEIEKPPACIEVTEGIKKIHIATYGNFSTLIGKAKGRKSFFTLMVMSAMLNGSYGALNGRTDHRKKILLFDTEQSPYHVNLNVNRIHYMCNLNEHHHNFTALALRPYTPAQRVKIIEDVLYNDDDICFAVIDGIRDLISNINSEEESTTITSSLLKWTEQRNIHILNVLHENKGNKEARGHIGSELENKSETLFAVNLVEGDKSTSVVESKRVRGGDFSPMYFFIDNDQDADYSKRLPVFIDDYNEPSKEGKQVKITNPAELPDLAHKTILNLSFKEQKEQSYYDLMASLDYALKDYGNPLGVSNRKQWITYYYQNERLYTRKEGRKTLYGLQDNDIPF